MTEKTRISQGDIISLASETIQGFSEYIPGMTISSAQQEGEVIIFRGETFLDEYGLPTDTSKIAFSLYASLSDKYSETYQLTE